MTKITSSYASTVNSTVKNRRFNLRYLNIGLFISIAACGVLYLININDLTVQGFVLRDLKSQANTSASLKADNEEVVNSLQAYSSVSERTRQLNMVAVGDVEYLAVARSVVARK
jgi:hypothetical protein